MYGRGQDIRWTMPALEDKLSPFLRKHNSIFYAFYSYSPFCQLLSHRWPSSLGAQTPSTRHCEGQTRRWSRSRPSRSSRSAITQRSRARVLYLNLRATHKIHPYISLLPFFFSFSFFLNVLWAGQQRQPSYEAVDLPVCFVQTSAQSLFSLRGIEIRWPLDLTARIRQ